MATAAANKIKAKTSVVSPVIKQVPKRGKQVEIKKQPSKRIPVMLTLKEAAELSGVNLFTIRSWVTTGKFPTVRSGRRWLVSETVLINYLNGTDTTDEGWN